MTTAPAPAAGFSERCALCPGPTADSCGVVEVEWQPWTAGVDKTTRKALMKRVCHCVFEIRQPSCGGADGFYLALLHRYCRAAFTTIVAKTDNVEVRVAQADKDAPDLDDSLRCARKGCIETFACLEGEVPRIIDLARENPPTGVEFMRLFVMPLFDTDEDEAIAAFWDPARRAAAGGECPDAEEPAKKV